MKSVTIKESFYFTIYPNPSDGKQFFMEIITDKAYDNKEVLVVVYDLLGNEAYSKVILTQQNEKQVIAMDPQNQLKPGVYIVMANSGEKILIKRKLVVQ